VEKLIVPGATNILLSHNPDVFPVSAQKGFDLMVSGHLHGGQIAVEILHYGAYPSRFYTPYVRGLYRLADRFAYVSRGIGTILAPSRLGALPEITLLTLRRP
jgi:predicted MPP superfamily phosphohydrolase